MLSKIATMMRALSELRELRSHHVWSAETLKLHQQQLFTSLRAHATAHSPFYQQFHRGLEAAPLEELPILTKSVMMEHFDDFVTAKDVRLRDVRAYLAQGSRGKFQGVYEVAATSGSTGNPGIFLFNPREWATVIASFARAREWAGLRLNFAQRSKMAVVSSTNEKNLSARVGKVADTPFLPTLRLNATDPIEDLITQLNRWQPNVLVAYASMAYFLAQEQVADRLHISPQKVFTSSEVLTPQMRKAVEQAWGDVVFNEYASTETASIAAEDIHHHGMHIFDDLLIVENVNEYNQPAPVGEFGKKLLVTVLYSRTQPLIRYEISDSVRFSAQQPSCGLPFRIVDGVQGRAEDMLVFQSRTEGSKPIHPVLFHDVMDTVPNKGWQIVKTNNHLTIYIVPSQPISEVVLRQKVTTALEQQHIIIPNIQVEEVAVIPKGSGGKSPLIKVEPSLSIA